MSQEQGTGAQHWAPGGALVRGVNDLTAEQGCWCLGQRADGQPQKGQVQLALLFLPKASPVQSWCLNTHQWCSSSNWTAFLPRATAMPVAARQAVSVSVLETLLLVAEPGSISQWLTKYFPLRHHQEGRRAKPDQWCSAYWQVREQTQLRVLEHKADNYRSPQANETLWLKLYWYIWKINLVIALQLCLIKATAVTWQVLPHHLPNTSHASTLAAFHRSWEPPDSNGAEPCFCWK